MCAFLDPLVALALLSNFQHTDIISNSFHEFFISPLVCQSCFNTALLLLYQYHAFSVIVSIFALKTTILHECIHWVKIPNSAELYKTKYSHLPSFFSLFFTPPPRNNHFQLFGICIFRLLSVCLYIYTHMYVIWNRCGYVNLHKYMYCFMMYFINLVICLLGDYMIIHKFLPYFFKSQNIS